MAQLEAIRDFSFNGVNYSIGHFSGETGSWLVQKFLKVFTDVLSTLEVKEETASSNEDAKDEPERLLGMLLMNLDEKSFSTVQRHALKVCARYENVGEATTAIPIIRADGSFSDKNLQYDIPTVLALTKEALNANLASFFTKNGLKLLMAVA